MNRVWRWRVATGEELPEGMAHSGPIAFAPPGQTLAAVTYSPVGGKGWHPLLKKLPRSRADVVFLGADTGRVLRAFPGPRGFVVALAFAPDGRGLVTAVSNEKFTRGEMVLWEVATGKERCRFPLKGAGLRAALAVSPDGRFLAFADGARSAEDWVDSPTIHLRDLATGKELRRFTGQRGEVLALAFTPDGTRLASGSKDTTALVWDTGGLIKERLAQASNLSPQELEARWADLAGADVATAYRAMGALVVARQAVPFLKERLQSLPRQDRQRIDRLIADLDSDDFAVRERATEELANLGGLAKPALEKALANRTSLEVRQRAEKLLGRLPKSGPSGADLRASRALEVLEQIDTPEVQRAFKALTREAPDAWLSQEAEAALGRMARRPPARP
jgi:hypothetical protein